MLCFWRFCFNFHEEICPALRHSATTPPPPFQVIQTSNAGIIYPWGYAGWRGDADGGRPAAPRRYDMISYSCHAGRLGNSLTISGMRAGEVRASSTPYPGNIPHIKRTSSRLSNLKNFQHTVKGWSGWTPHSELGLNARYLSLSQSM